MSEILDNIYIWVFSINSESVLLLALVKYMLCSHFTQNCIFCTFWRLKILVLWRKIVENLLIFVYLFCPKNGAIDFTKTFITQKWLVVESCPTPRWITFLMLYQLVYNIRSHFNELILAWSAYLCCWGIYILQPSEFRDFMYVFSLSHLNVVVLHIIMFVYHT